APREDVHVGPDRMRVVERSCADEERVAGGLIPAPEIRAAGAAEEDVVVPPAAAGQAERLRNAARLDELLLDPEVDHEGAAGEPLAVTAVAGVDDERAGAQLVAHGSARATTDQPHGTSLVKAPAIVSRATCRDAERGPRADGRGARRTGLRAARRPV